MKFIYDNWLDDGLSLLSLAVSMQGPVPMPHWLCPPCCSLLILCQTGRSSPGGKGCGWWVVVSLRVWQDVGDTEDVTRSPIFPEEQECHDPG